MAARKDGIARRVRRVGGLLIRRLGLLPEGDPDGLGDDESLRGQSLPFEVMVYFPDTVRNLYQLRQWADPLRRLDERHRVGVVCLDSRTAARVCEDLPGLPVVCTGRIATLEDLVSRSDIALALYVNHNIRNLHPLRFPTMLHAYLGHGESDKASSASNQVKAYDFVLVPGPAGKDRLARNLLRYDADAHVRLVGRPQLDPGGAAPAGSRTDGPTPSGKRPTVLYAPTWEGAQPSMAYSSVVSHGAALLRSLLGSRGFHVVYRPHPRTGANQAAYGHADRELRALVATYAKDDPDGCHRVDTSPVWDARGETADVLVADVSAMVGDWIATGRPVVVTVPSSPAAVVEAEGVLTVAPVLPANAAGTAADLVSQALGQGVTEAERAWVEHAMGDTTPGTATELFLAVCDELVALRSVEVAARSARLSR